MFEAKISIDAPELAASINNLAIALNNVTGAVLAAKAAGQVTVAAPVDSVAPAVTDTPAEVAQTPTAPAQEAAKATPTAAKNEKTYTIDDLSCAGAELIDNGKMPQLIDLLKKNGVQAITQLKPEQYLAVATELIALGANL